MTSLSSSTEAADPHLRDCQESDQHGFAYEFRGDRPSRLGIVEYAIHAAEFWARLFVGVDALYVGPRYPESLPDGVVFEGRLRQHGITSLKLSCQQDLSPSSAK